MKDFQKSDGQNYAPKGLENIVCEAGEFIVGVCRMDHGHIYGMCNGLKEAGAEIKYVFDYDKTKIDTFLKSFPNAIVVESEESLLNIEEINLIATSAIPNERFQIGLKTLDKGKDFFSDKPPFTSIEQVDLARKKVKETNLKWFVYYSERLHVESAIYAGQLIDEDAIGDIVSIKGWGPHRISLSSRPEWFFNKEQFGGILTDIGSHQLEQVLYYAKAKDAKLISSRVGNLKNKEYPKFEDYGDATYITDNNIPCYISVDWFTPDGLSTWGDGRLIISGTKGYIELRKYLDVARSNEPDNVILVNDKEEKHICVHNKVGFPFFGQLIRDCLDRTELAISQEHTFKAIELAIEAQDKAIVV